MTKSLEMKALQNEIAKEFFGRSATEAFIEAICVDCGKPIEGFRDEISEKEYRITGLCQKCQDSIFE
jgi:hypothetical protein